MVTGARNEVREASTLVLLGTHKIQTILLPRLTTHLWLANALAQSLSPMPGFVALSRLLSP